jgi:adenine-specific DNA-methyltransferase
MDSSKMTGHSTNPQAELLAKLMHEMPEIFSEGKIDSKKLKATLGEDVVTDQERYGFTWAGKSECFKKIQETTTNTLKPCRDESVDFDKTENLFIEGDNLQVLKVLQKSYYGKVKMIYIDPPYNTGNDFIYNDKFSRSKREELIANGSIDDEGNIVNHDLYRQNTRDSGHFHSNWLNMMYPRLFLARNLLRQDGVIFVSIDDNEVKNLRAMMDEIFGEENFVDCIVWKKRYGGGAKEKHYVTLHEYVLVYARNIEVVDDITVPLTEDSIKRYYTLKDENFEIRGPFRTHPLEATKSMGDRTNLIFPIKAPDGTEIMPQRQWLWSKERVKQAQQDAELYFIKNKKGWTVHTKQYLRDKNGENRRGKMQSIIDDVFTQHGTNEIIDYFGNAQIFPFPKPSTFISKFVTSITDKDDIILDFFAGSGTAAHAVMQLNAEDGGNRKWICVQLPEKCKEDTEAAKAGFVTIADIAKERIRRASWEIFTKKTITVKTLFKISAGDTRELEKERKRYQEWLKSNPQFGFKAFKLDESNFKIWNMQIANVEQLERQLMEFIDNVRPESTTEDMLYELILKSGLELNIAIEEKQADGKKYHRIGDGSLIICLADKLTKPLFEAILKDKPEKIITLDRAFANNDELKTNMMLDAEHAGVKEFKVI